MNFDQGTKLFELVISLLQTIGWPLVVLIIFLYLRETFKVFIESIIEVNLKAGPVETTAKRQLTEVAVSLGAATAYWEDVIENNKVLHDVGKTKDIAKLIEQLVTPQFLQQIRGVSVLWVDDRPINNTYERQALEALGIQFTISKSTEDAVERLQRKNYNVIISDICLVTKRSNL